MLGHINGNVVSRTLLCTVKGSKASAALVCLFWGKLLQEKQEPADETVARVMQGSGKLVMKDGSTVVKRGLRGAWCFPAMQKALAKGNYGFHVLEEQDVASGLSWLDI